MDRNTRGAAHEWSVVNGTRTELGESPLWSPRRGSLFWVDILKHTIYEWTIAESRVRRYPMPDLVGWIIECRSGNRFIIGLGNDFAELHLQPQRVKPLLLLKSTGTPTRLNDAKADVHGSIFAGTMAIDADAPIGNLYRLDPTGEIALLDTGYTIPNGPAFSNDGRLHRRRNATYPSNHELRLRRCRARSTIRHLCRCRKARRSPRGGTFRGRRWCARVATL